MTIDHAALERSLSRVPWFSQLVTLKETASTNDDGLRLGAAGAPNGTVIVAEVQTAGRGRLGRAWWSEPGTTLTASLVLRPDEPIESWTLVPLACGVATATAVTETSGLRASVKWPNDVLIGERKLAGLLVEARPPDFLVAGIGVNLSCTVPDELAGSATSIALEGAAVPERGALLAALMIELGTLLSRNNVIERYRRLCSTLGRNVRVERIGEEAVEGLARDIEPSGALRLATAHGNVVVASGDVVHLRPL